MNELKPEDVMRALECHSGDGDCFKVCPYFTSVYDESCLKNLVRDALALLREKDATLEMCAEVIKRQDKELAKKDAEIERLNKERDDARRDCAVAEQNHYECKKELETARAEAITEFAGMLKEAVKYIPWCDYPQVHRCIDEIAEKMKGEEDGNLDL